MVNGYEGPIIMALAGIGNVGTTREIKDNLDEDFIIRFHLDKPNNFANKLRWMSKNGWLRLKYSRTNKQFWGYTPQVYELKPRAIECLKNGKFGKY